ncbi:MAG: SDR family oxidoreductase [Pontimonas sp.]
MSPERGYIVVGARGQLGSHIFTGLKAEGSLVLGVDVAQSETETDEIEVCDFSSPRAVRGYFDERCDGLKVGELVMVLAQGRIHNEPVLRLEGSQLVTHEEGSWDDVITSNLKTAFVGATEFARMCRMKRMPGVVIAFSSISAGGAPGQLAYSAAKGAIESMVKALARELGPVGIRAVSIAPGYIDTPSTRRHMTESRLESVTQRTPVRRLGTPGEILSTIKWIATTEYVSGTTIEVSGGLTL